MSKNPSEKGMKKDEQHHHKVEPLGQKKENTVSSQDRKKPTVNFEEGQKFTSDEDIITRRTA